MRPNPVLAVLALALFTTVAASADKRRSAPFRGGPAAAPIASNDAYEAEGGETLVVAASGVLANDTLNGALIVSYGKSTGGEQTTIGAATATEEGGEVSLRSDGGFTYEPPSSFSGNDSFKYIVQNASGTSSATVTVMVLAQPPNAVNDSYDANEDTTLTVTSSNGVLNNDTLNGGAIVSYGASSGSEQTTLNVNTATAQGGTVRITSAGAITYTPAANFSGNDTFKYKLANSGGEDVATVTIDVADAPDIDFVVTSPGSFFQFSGVSGQNPTLTLQRGRTYRFDVRTSPIHPFEILGAPPGSVTNNDISNGILTFAVPAGDGTYTYHCSIHDFGGNINDVP